MSLLDITNVLLKYINIYDIISSVMKSFQYSGSFQSGANVLIL